MILLKEQGGILIVDSDQNCCTAVFQSVVFLHYSNRKIDAPLVAGLCLSLPLPQTSNSGDCLRASSPSAICGQIVGG